MIHAQDLKKSVTGYQKLLNIVEEKIKAAAEQGRTRTTIDVGGSASIAESIVPELKQNGYLAYVDYGNTSEGRYKLLRVSWERDTSSPPSTWESFKFFMNI